MLTQFSHINIFYSTSWFPYHRSVQYLPCFVQNCLMLAGSRFRLSFLIFSEQTKENIPQAFQVLFQLACGFLYVSLGSRFPPSNMIMSPLSFHKANVKEQSWVPSSFSSLLTIYSISSRLTLSASSLPILSRSLPLPTNFKTFSTVLTTGHRNCCSLWFILITFGRINPGDILVATDCAIAASSLVKDLGVQPKPCSFSIEF